MPRPLSAYDDVVASVFRTRSETTTTPTPATDLDTGTRIGPYKVLEKIGEGGMGASTWPSKEPFRRYVALKVMSFGMGTPALIARFEAERQALALMNHPNIARVFDGGLTATGRPYVVMELVEGVSVTEFCDRERKSA